MFFKGSRFVFSIVAFVFFKEDFEKRVRLIEGAQPELQRGGLWDLSAVSLTGQGVNLELLPLFP